MNLLNICLILISATTVLALSTSIKDENALKHELKKLHSMEKFLLLAASKLQPAVFKGIKIEEFMFEPFDYPYIDTFFVDLRSILTQAKLITDETNLPEMDYLYKFDFCFWGLCFDVDMSVKSRNTKILGAHDVTSETEITPTSFRNTYTVPYVKWSSPGFMFNITDNDSKSQFLNRDLHISMDGMQTVLSANYEFNPNLGIQISNLTIEFSLNSLILNIEEQSSYYGDGRVEKYGPLAQDYKDYVVYNWELYREEYQSGLELRINCILSGGRVSSENCEADPDNSDGGIGESVVMYYKMNVVQLFETIGMAALIRD